MKRLASLSEVLGAALLIGLLLGLVEGLLATPQIGEPVLARLLGVGLIDVLVFFAGGSLAGLVAAALPRKRPVGLWARIAAVLPLLVVGLVGSAIALNRSTLDAELEGSMTHEQPLPTLVSQDGTVVLITLDTLRPDALEHMPLLAARARTGRVYTKAHSTAPWTLPAMASLHTGETVHGHGAGARVPGQGNHVRAPFDEALPTLAERLVERGYVTAAVVTNPYLGVRYGFHAGFDRFHDLARRTQLNVALRRTFLLRLALDPVRDTASFTTDQALELYEPLRRGRALLWVHYIDAHAPYHTDAWTPGEACQLPDCFEDWQSVRKGESVVQDRERVRQLYLHDLARLDEALDALLAEVLVDAELVVLTADHGEEFWDHGGVEHGASFHEEIVGVPLIVWGAGIGESDRHVDLVGVHDALLSWTDDRSLGPLEPEGPDALTPMASLLFGEETSACTDGRTKWLEHGRYDLVEDPGETTLLPAEAVACLPGPLPEYEGELPDDLSVLRSLGYVD